MRHVLTAAHPVGAGACPLQSDTVAYARWGVAQVWSLGDGKNSVCSSGSCEGGRTAVRPLMLGDREGDYTSPVFIVRSSFHRFKPGLEEAEVPWFVDHAQATGLMTLIVHCLHRLGHNIHVSLGIDSARDGQPG